MGRTKELLQNIDDVQRDMIDEQYQYDLWNSNRERVFSRTPQNTILTEIFTSFGEVFNNKKGGEQYEV